MRLRALSRGAFVVLALAGAAALALLAVDVIRAPRVVASDDARFNAAPLRQAGLWEDVDFLPRTPTDRLLGLEDDLTYRRVLAHFARLRPGSVKQLTALDQEHQWALLQFKLITRSREEEDPERRSRLQNLLGVLALARFGYVVDQERVQVLTNALGTFRSAIELDPSNEEAKLNLELVLRLFGPSLFSSDGPNGGAARGQLSGQGRSGSGY